MKVRLQSNVFLKEVLEKTNSFFLKGTMRYREQTFATADVAVRVACSELNVNLHRLLPLVKSNNDKTALALALAFSFAIDVDVEDKLSLVLPIGETQPLIVANAVNLFVNVDVQANINWYVCLANENLSDFF